MELSILVAKILGIYFVVSGLFLVLKGKTVTHLLKDFFDHPSIVYLTGVILIFLSSAYLIQHSVWNGTWETIITIFAWLVLFKGLAYIFIPEALNEIVIKKYRGLFGVCGVIAVIVGASLFFLF